MIPSIATPRAPRARWAARVPWAASLLVAAALGLAGCAVPAPASVGSAPASVGSPQTPAGPAPALATVSPIASPIASPASAGTTPPPTPAACPTPAASFVHAAPGTGKTVALTFDDGPAEADRTIVEVLDRYGVHATFFETGRHAQALPDVVRLLAAHGDLVEDHTWDHQYPSAVSGGWTPAYLADQLTRTDALLTSLSGAGVCFLRPPGGYTQNVLTAASKQRLTSVLWSIDSADWKQPGHTTTAATRAIVTAATAASSQTHPIVLLHSGKASHEPDSTVSPYRGNTVAALPSIIEWYQAHGYAFVRLDGQS